MKKKTTVVRIFLLAAFAVAEMWGKGACVCASDADIAEPGAQAQARIAAVEGAGMADETNCGSLADKTLGSYGWRVEKITSNASGSVISFCVSNNSGKILEMTRVTVYLFDVNGDRLFTQEMILPDINAEGAESVEMVCDGVNAADISDYTVAYKDEWEVKTSEQSNFPLADVGHFHLGPKYIYDKGYLGMQYYQSGSEYVIVNLSPQMYREKIVAGYRIKMVNVESKFGDVVVEMTVSNTTDQTLAGCYMNLYFYTYKRDKAGQVLAVKIPEIEAHGETKLRLKTEQIGVIYAFDWNSVFSQNAYENVTPVAQTGLIDYVENKKALVTRDVYIPQEVDGKMLFITSMYYNEDTGKLSFLMFKKVDSEDSDLKKNEWVTVYMGNRQDKKIFVSTRTYPSLMYYTFLGAFLRSIDVSSEADAARINALIDSDIYKQEQWTSAVQRVDEDKTTSEINIRKFSGRVSQKKYIQLTWKGTKRDVIIFRKKGKKGTYKKYSRVMVGQRYFTDRNVKSKTTYYYKALEMKYIVIDGEKFEDKYTAEDFERAAPIKVRMPDLLYPQIKLKKASAKKYVQITFGRYEGDYAQIQVKNKKGYVNIPLKKGKISRYKGIYKLKYKKEKQKLTFRARTWINKGGKRIYSGYSSAKTIRV